MIQIYVLLIIYCVNVWVYISDYFQANLNCMTIYVLRMRNEIWILKA